MSGKPFLSSVPRVALLALFAATGMNLKARAQTMDYGALEKTFGEAVTTSATGQPQRATDAPVDMVIVTAEDIRRSGAHDIPGILRHVAGVDVAQWTNDDADVSVDGYNQPYSSRLLVLVDGRQVYADFYGVTPWSAIPVELSAIRQIEIVKGPSAALFGFNAAGGVINIVTYSPLYDNANTAAAIGGTQNLGEGAATLTLHDDSRMGLRATVGGSVNDDFRTPIPAGVGGVSRRHDYRGEISLDGVYRISDSTQLGLEASHSVAARNEIYPGYTLDQATYWTDSVRGTLASDTAAGLVSLSAYTNWQASNLQTSLGGPVAYHPNDVMTVVQLSDVFETGADSTFRLAAEYRHDAAGTFPFQGGHVFYNVYSASAMWNWRITSTLSLTNAVREDYLTLGRTGTVPANYLFTNADWGKEEEIRTSFNSGLVWKPDDDNTLRLMASHGSELPNLVDLGSFLQVSPPSSLSGSPGTDPFGVAKYEASWDRVLEDFNATLDASLFYQETTNIISEASAETITASGIWLTPSVIGNSHAYGGEIALKGIFDSRWRWGLSYRFESVEDDFGPPAQDGVNYVDYQHSTPHHLLNANLGWSNDRWEIDGYARYQSRIQGIVPDPVTSAAVLTPVAGYVSLDGRLAYRLDGGFTLALSGQNLGQDHQRQTTAPDVERRILFTVSKSF
ncbi:MAG TPA: TonB-dependent receptor [Rhizomicrobium sp.]|nr:TonB-dependent receptor [Rhizomicrobium sp.]